MVWKKARVAAVKNRQPGSMTKVSHARLVQFVRFRLLLTTERFSIRADKAGRQRRSW
jgi:hypothetical protein